MEESRRRSPGGCFQRFGCCAVGFLAGLLFIPLSLWLLFQVAAVRDRLPGWIDLGKIKSWVESLTRGGPGDKQDAEDDGAAGDTSDEMFLQHGDLVIRYRCSRRAQFSMPFVNGVIENHGKSPVIRLTLTMTIKSSTGKSSHNFEILRNTMIPAGGQSRFAVHPSTSPSTWKPGGVSLSVQDVSYQ